MQTLFRQSSGCSALNFWALARRPSCRPILIESQRLREKTSQFPFSPATKYNTDRKLLVAPAENSRTTLLILKEQKVRGSR